MSKPCDVLPFDVDQKTGSSSLGAEVGGPCVAPFPRAVEELGIENGLCDPIGLDPGRDLQARAAAFVLHLLGPLGDGKVAPGRLLQAEARLARVPRAAPGV